MNINSPKPSVLIFAGHDPSGGAGVMADAQTLTAHGFHAASVITALTLQNSQEFFDVSPVDAELIVQQADILLADLDVKAVKIGLIPNADIAQALAEWVADLPCNVPVVFDPVLAAGSGGDMNNRMTRRAWLGLYENVTMITPNSEEVLALTGLTSMDAAADWLLKQGCESVLITGGHLPELRNCLYEEGGKQAWLLDRVQGEFRGTGCRMASAVAAQLVGGESKAQAVAKAQNYLAAALSHATPISRRHPCSEQKQIPK